MKDRGVTTKHSGGKLIASQPNGKDSYRVRTGRIDKKPYIRTEIELSMDGALTLFDQR